MPKRTAFNPDAPFQKISGASRLTGLSQSDIRAGCKAGRYPHVMRGRDYLVNVPLLLSMLEQESRGAVQNS